MDKYYLRSKKGFTLVEVIIVVAIIGILSSVSLYSLTSSRNNKDLRTAQREISSSVSLARSYALQGIAIPNSTAGAPCGYGFRFVSPESYEIFYIKTSSSNTCANFSYSGCLNSGSNCVRLEEYTLSGNVRIKEDIAGTEIYFSVPHGDAYQNSGALFSDRTLTIETSSGSATKTIMIGASGSVVEN